MTPRGSIAKKLAAGAVMALAVLAWLVFAPRQLGGSVTYVVTDGTSMSPVYESGDLVLVRARDEVEVGDVVAYNSKALGKIVLHRIVAIEGEHYVFKGDNNDWLDSERPTAGDLVGKRWFEIPGVGKVLSALGNSRVLPAILAGAIALILLIGARKKKSEPRRASGRSLEGLPRREIAAGAVAVLILSLAVAGIAFARPLTAPAADEVSYRNEGEFTYQAEANKGPVYDDGRADTGEPLFRDLVDEAEVTFDYRFHAPKPASVSGTISMAMVVGESSGWRRSFELAGPASFDGDRASVTGIVDVRRLERLTEAFRRQTGSVASVFTIDLVPEVTVDGTLEGAPVQASFSPPLSLQMDAIAIGQSPTTAAAAQATDPLHPVSKGSVPVQVDAPVTISLGPLDVPLSTLRIGAIVVAALALLVLLLTRTIPSMTEVPHRMAPIIQVKDVMSPPGGRVVEVTTLEDLTALADRYGRSIMHKRTTAEDAYFVEEASILYCFRSERRRHAGGPPPPPPPPHEAAAHDLASELRRIG